MSDQSTLQRVPPSPAYHCLDNCNTACPLSAFDLEDITVVNVFAAPAVFFICLRESLECAVIVAVLLAFVDQVMGAESNAIVRRKLIRQVWLGGAVGVVVCIGVGAGMIGAWYGFGKNHFAKTEDIWEGTFALVACLIISFVGIGLLRVNKMTDKWGVKISKALQARSERQMEGRLGFKQWAERYFMFLLPLVTVLREGLEAVVFIGGVGLTLPAASFPLAAISSLAAGSLVGYILYRFGNSARLQIFLIISTCFLYLIAAGLFSKCEWYFENYAWAKAVGGDSAETGSGAGSYDVRQSVWHVNCCNPLLNGGGGWGVFNSLLGWQNSATYGSVLSYNLYWLVTIITFISLGSRERYGRWPMMKAKADVSEESSDVDSSQHDAKDIMIASSKDEQQPTIAIQEIETQARV